MNVLTRFEVQKCVRELYILDMHQQKHTDRTQALFSPVVLRQSELQTAHRRRSLIGQGHTLLIGWS